MKKYSKLDLANLSQPLQHSDARISFNLDEVCKVLDNRGPFACDKGHTKMFVVFGFDTSGKDMLVRKRQIKMVGERILREVEEEFYKEYDSPGTKKVLKLVTPSLWLLDAELNHQL